MRITSIYIDNQRIDLFKDEQVSITSKSRDAQNVAKVFTDYSQTFSVPASPKNNAILGHYYDTNLGTFNANVRVDARIQTDTIPFREGKIQLEGSTIKNNQVESYKITFFGDVVSLKDAIGTAKLSDLDYSGIQFIRTQGNVIASMQDATYQDVRFPLISPSSIWNVDGSTGVDIAASGLDYKDLFPAISDSKIMNMIQVKYGLTFTGGFVESEKMQKSFTYYKNTLRTNVFTTIRTDIPFNVGGTDTLPILINNPLSESTASIEYVDMSSYDTSGLASFGTWMGQEWHRLKMTVTPTTWTGSNGYFIDVYRNGVFHLTFESEFAESFEVVDYTPNVSGLNDQYTFKGRSLFGGFDISVDFEYNFRANYLDASNNLQFVDHTANEVGLVTLSTYLELSAIAPDMTILEWLTGTMKQFHLTCYPESTGVYNMIPTDEWYDNGRNVDISEWVITDTIKKDRVKLYRELDFTYLKSKSLMNTEFASLFGREYGSLTHVFPDYDGGKNTVKLPFETIMFNNIEGVANGLQVAYTFGESPEYKAFIPKAIKIVLGDSVSCTTFIVHDGPGINNISLSDYIPFGQDFTVSGVPETINFGSEISTQSLNIVGETLYRTGYQAYLSNMFQAKTRKVTLKAILPVPVITRLALNDAIHVRDK